MVDELNARYGDLLSGSYDCVDRIVLNAYFSLGHNPGGFRTWWRRHLGVLVDGPTSTVPVLDRFTRELGAVGARRVRVIHPA